MNSLEAVTADSRVQQALLLVKESLPSGQNWDKNKETIVDEVIQNVVAMVELREKELAPLKESRDRVSKVLELERRKLIRLTAAQAVKFLPTNKEAGQSVLLLIAGVAIVVAVEQP